jgi:prohibitin 2
MNNQQEAFRRFAQQLQRASQGGGFQGGSPRGLYTGGGLVVALIAGGLALNASLFNGTDAIPLFCFLHSELIG